MIPTKDELLELKAFIAEKVMGYKWYRFKEKSGPYYSLQKPAEWQIRHGGKIVAKPPTGAVRDIDVPGFPTDPAAAMEVLKKCAEVCAKDGTEPTILIRLADGLWYVECDDSWICCYQNADTLELAICQFAKALFRKAK